MKSIIDPSLFDIALSGEVIRFFSYDPQAELTKRKIIDFVPGK
jgi:hypothetical protein